MRCCLALREIPKAWPAGGGIRSGHSASMWSNLDHDLVPYGSPGFSHSPVLLASPQVADEALRGERCWNWETRFLGAGQPFS